MKLRKLSIIIPVYNEERTLSTLLNAVLNVDLIYNIQKEIIIIDDASWDGSQKIILNFKNSVQNVAVINKRLPKNTGKGACIKEGIKLATGNMIIVQDADLEYNPKDFNLLLQKMQETQPAAVYGSRFKDQDSSRRNRYWHYLGNQLLTHLSNIINRQQLTDMETCYKLIKSDVLKSLKLKEKRFGFEPEVTSKLARLSDQNIEEVAISYRYRNYRDGKKIGWKDAVRTAYCLIKYGLLKMD